jgi:hypothetical protein
MAMTKLAIFALAILTASNTAAVGRLSRFSRSFQHSITVGWASIFTR